MRDPSSEFAHVRRIRDPRFPYEIASILPGQYFVSDDPMIVHTVLGSCIAACIRDPVSQVGGMNHFMLPIPTEAESDLWGTSARYGSYAMELLIDSILKRGGVKSRLEVKLFGGGRIYDGGVDIGAYNIRWVLMYLEREGLQPVTSDLGEMFPRKVYYFTATGRVLLRRMERLRGKTFLHREQRYRAFLEKYDAKGTVTLFERPADHRAAAE